MKKLLFVVSICFAFAATAQVKIPEHSKLIINQVAQLNIEPNQESQLQNLEKYPIQKIGITNFLCLIAKVKPGFSEENLPEGFILGGGSGDIFSLKVPTNRLDKLLEIPQVEVITVARKIAPQLEDARIDLRLDSVWNYPLNNTVYTGKDVLIGITDWGFDYTHPMFYDTALQHTRIAAVWDQFKIGGTRPSGFNYGAEYDTENEILTAKHDTASTYYDFATHGSHVAGIAGGGLKKAGLMGVAPEAEFLFCQFGLNEAAAMDAIAWMRDKAQSLGKRLVVNMSWGLYHIGTLDGNSLFSQYIENLAQEGIIMVSSGGNNGDEPFHIQKTFTGDTISSRVSFYPYSAHQFMWGQNLIMWGEPNQAFTAWVEVHDANGFVASSPVFNTSQGNLQISGGFLANSDSIKLEGVVEQQNPLNNRPHILLGVQSKNPNHRIILYSTANSGEVHYWNVTNLSSGAGNWGMPFSAYGKHGVAGDNLYGIGEPTCAEKVISVAAHEPEKRFPNGFIDKGDIANFSSIGPALGGNEKPNVSAPGVSITSSINSYTSQSYTPVASYTFNGRKYDFARFSGTSMASPAVAGVVALLIEAKPDITFDEIMGILQQSCRADEKTGDLVAGQYHTTWGWGKVSANRALELLVVGNEEVSIKNKLSIFPNPTSQFIQIEGVNPWEVNSLAIYDMQGKLVKLGLKNNVLSIRSLPNGVYVVKIETATQAESLKFLKY